MLVVCSKLNQGATELLIDTAFLKFELELGRKEITHLKVIDEQNVVEIRIYVATRRSIDLKNSPKSITIL